MDAKEFARDRDSFFMFITTNLNQLNHGYVDRELGPNSRTNARQTTSDAAEKYGASAMTTTRDQNDGSAQDSRYDNK